MKYILAIITVLLYTTLIYAQPGTLDKSFGNEGTLIGTEPLTSVRQLVEVQKDGNIIVGGSGAYKEGITFRLTRYLSDGTIDSSFGEGGKAYATFLQTGIPVYGLQINALAIQEDGRIVAAQGGFALAIARFNQDGTIDSSFGINGTLYDLYDPLKKVYSVNDIVVQQDGKIVLGGSQTTKDKFGNPTTTFALFRRLPNSTADENFGSNGIVTSSKGFEIKALALQKDGKIAAGGYSGLAMNYDNVFYTERYLNDGTIDKSFGTNGGVATYFENEYCMMNDLALQPDGKIVVVGYLIAKPGSDILMARYNTNGELDKTFNDSGKVVTSLPTYGTYATNVLIIPNGKIVVAGSNGDAYVSNSGNFALTSYNMDGSLDKSFGDNGFTISDITGGDEGIASAALQPDGKIIALGNKADPKDGSKLYSVLARYYGPADKQPLAIRIKRWLQHDGISWQYNAAVRYYTVQKSSDGITYKEVARVSSSTSTYEDASVSAGNYYRIVAAAKDGSRTYSNTILIDEAQSARIFPNPVKDNLQLQGLPASGKTNLSVMDLQGNVRSSATATGTNYSVSTANLSSGSYLLQIQHNGTTLTQPFVKE